MESFIWWIVGVWGFEIVVKIICLGVGHIPERKPIGVAIDALIGIYFVGWGILLLNT